MEGADGLKEQIERTVGAGTVRFADRLIEIRVVVSDVNGPRGGADKCCSIRGVLEGGRSVTVAEQGTDAFAVVSRAVRRLSSSIGRVLVRGRQRRAPAMKPAPR